jgi:hypothetical protein
MAAGAEILADAGHGFGGPWSTEMVRLEQAPTCILSGQTTRADTAVMLQVPRDGLVQ